MKSRTYVQGRRAEAAAATHTRILEAAVAAFLELGTVPTLDTVAARAGVTVQTILRRFGSKEGLHAAAAAHARGQVAAFRDQAPVGDVQGAIANLVAHYAEWAHVALRLQMIEERGTEAAEATAGARSLHHAWVERVFGPQLDTLAEAERARRLAQLVAVTDVHVWQVLRRDLGLPVADVHTTLVDLVRRVLA